MEKVFRILGYAFVGVTVVLTVVMLVTFRKERRIRALSTLISLGLSALMLPVFVLISRARLNPLVAWPALGLGFLGGVLWALATRIYHKGRLAMAQHSVWYLVGWGASWALSQLLVMFGSRLLASASLLAAFLSTGVQVGVNVNLLVRLATLKPAPAAVPPSWPQPAPGGWTYPPGQAPGGAVSYPPGPAERR